MKAGQRASFRVRLAWQTVLVAGSLVALFGAGSWIYARAQLARNLDLRIMEESRRLWAEITPKSPESEFAQAVAEVFGGEESGPGVVVLSHSNPSRVLFNSLANAPVKTLEVHLPDTSGMVINTDFTAGEAIARGPRLRPQMPTIREAVFFSVEMNGSDWRFGALSSPNYTVFVGHSMKQFYAAVRHAGMWFGGAALVALLLAGLGAWWLSGRAMRPLDRVLSTAERLGAGNLRERIPLSVDDDREFERLIVTLNAMTDRLEASFEQAARFTADASHELKTPLAMMQNSLSDLLREPSLTGSVRDRIETLLRDNGRLKHITQSLLLLSQADGGKLQMEQREYDLSASLAGLVEDAETLCEAHELTFEQSIEPGIHIKGDASQMYQVFQNLLSNAVKYNRSGGRVSMTLGCEGEEVTLAIGNSGPGISPEAQLRLFERFFRADESRHTEGLGLGLNIAFELAKANGAELRLAKSDAEFTLFTVRMALVKPSAVG
jgi:two-component system, OmpR family, heavy metal sensor histidine kinase CusS